MRARFVLAPFCISISVSPLPPPPPSALPLLRSLPPSRFLPPPCFDVRPSPERRPSFSLIHAAAAAAASPFSLLSVPARTSFCLFPLLPFFLPSSFLAPLVDRRCRRRPQRKKPQPNSKDEEWMGGRHEQEDHHARMRDPSQHVVRTSPPPRRSPHSTPVLVITRRNRSELGRSLARPAGRARRP